MYINYTCNIPLFINILIVVKWLLHSTPIFLQKLWLIQQATS